jgi:hypothetical protein
VTQPTAADSPQVQMILATARSGSLPQGWFVWHLRRDWVLRAALGWALTALFGFVLFVPIALATVPSNFQRSAALAVFTAVLLIVLGAVGFGGLGLMIGDLVRVARADQYLLVMTPTDYVKQVPGRLTHVPMSAVAYVTLKGVRRGGGGPAAQSQTPVPPPPGFMGGMGGRLSFGSGYRREMRRPPSLAFLDLRTQREVIVSTDDAFDALPVLEEVLQLYAGGGAPAPKSNQ